MAESVWIGTSWKMTKTLGEAREYARVLARMPVPPGVQPFLMPPHTALVAVRDALPHRSPVLLGAQNAHWAPEGAFTGEISMRMVADAGASLVEIGHSERRRLFAETDETVSRKVRAALDAGLTPLVCVGEPAAVRAAGAPEGFVADQVAAALSRVAGDEVGRVVVAYEPVWAIGEAGRPAEPEEVAPVVERIRRVASRTAGGRSLRAVLYGGSVDTGNALGLLAGTAADGLFVGRAAWTPAGLGALLEVGGTHASALRAGSAGGHGPSGSSGP